MSSHGETRRFAYDAACALAAEGVRPSAKAIRERLGGGGQQALLAGLNDWVDEAARRFQVPGIPEELRAALVALWDLACQHGEARWTDQRESLELRLGEAQQAHANTLETLDTTTARIGAQDTEIAAAREALQQAQDAGQAATIELEARTQQLSERQEELAGALSDREGLTRQLDHERRVAAAARESLEVAQTRIAELQAQCEVELARSQMLEGALADAKVGAEEAKVRANEARTDLEHSHNLTVELRESLADNQVQIRSLADAVEREQRGREKDGEHWLARIAEAQASIARGREREAALANEKRAAVEEAAQLRQQLHEALLPPALAGQENDRGDR